MTTPEAHTQIRGQRTFTALKKDQIARGAIAALSVVYAVYVMFSHGKTRKVEKSLSKA